MKKSPELENHYKVPKNENSISNSLCIQRSKRAQKFYNKDYTVNFSRIRVEKTDRLTRSKTRLDPNFLINQKLSKPLSQAICTIKSKNHEVMNEFLEHNVKNVDNMAIMTVTSDFEVLTSNINSNENRSDNLPGKRDILLTSMMNDLEIPKNNSHTELIAFENEVIEFNPATDLDLMLKTSIDPDEYLSSLSQEEIGLPLEIATFLGNTTTPKEDQKVESLSINQSEMVKKENKFEEISNNGKQFSSQSLQLFEKTITSQVPEIILKSEDETTLEKINDIPSQSSQEILLSTNKDHFSANKEIKLQNVVLKPKNNKNVLQNQRKHINDILSQKNMKGNRETPKIMLQSSLSMDQGNDSSSIWDQKMVKYDISRNETDTEKIIKTVDYLGTKDRSSSLAQSKHLFISENSMELEISATSNKNSHGNYIWNSSDQCDNNPGKWEPLIRKNQFHQYPSIETSSTIRQEIISTIKNRPPKASPILNKKNQFEVRNNTLIERHSVEKHTHAFGEDKQIFFQGHKSDCDSQLSSSNIRQFDICTEIYQEEQNMPKAQSLWDTPAEDFLKTDQSFSKQFAISGGSIERVFSPTLKNIQKNSKYPGITIPTSLRDIFFPNPSQQPMELENFEDEPKYQIELVDTPPPLVGNYKASRSTPQITANELRPPPVESSKQKTVFKSKRGRRTRAEMQLHREEMARRNQNKKKTDMERYIPNYFNQFNDGRNQMTAETPFASDLIERNANKLLTSAPLDFESWKQVSSERVFMTHQTPPIRPSCSKLGHQVSESAAILHNEPLKYCHKRIEAKEHNPYENVHQLYQSVHQVRGIHHIGTLEDKQSPYTSQHHNSASQDYIQHISKPSAGEQLHPMFQQQAYFCEKLEPDHLLNSHQPFHTSQTSQEFEYSRSYFP